MPGRIDGGSDQPERPALAEAMRALSLPKRPPTDDDARPATRLPMTPGQRAALRYSKRGERTDELEPSA